VKASIAWSIDQSGKPRRLKPGPIDLEKSLEDWVDADADIVADDVLVIGRQLSTSWGTVLDLLAIDAEGNLVVIELKRDQTLRETIAQGLEYAAWVSKLGYDDIIRIVTPRFEDEDGFKAAFAERFKADVPATLNQLQRILVVAPTIDDTTDTVVRYLADTFKLPINAVSFDVFGTPGDQVLVRHFVRDQTDIPSPPTTKRRLTRTIDQLLELSAANGVGDVVNELMTLKDLFPQVYPYYLAFNLRGRTPDGKRVLSGISVYSTSETLEGKVLLLVGNQNIVDLLGVDPAKVTSAVDSLAGFAQQIPYNYPGWSKFVLTEVAQAKEVCDRIRRLKPAGLAFGASPSLEPLAGSSPLHSD
jgi:hypothetical protein